MGRGLFVICIFCLTSLLRAQEPIADNSFLIEEAYNQEPGVVQHISNLVYSRPHKDMEFSFTQEWPLFTVKHQVSYSIPYAWLNKNNVNGLGDIFINYRYQLYDQNSWAAIAPRLSVILPSGDDKKGLGSGKMSYQVNLPISTPLADKWMAHANAGATMTPGTETMNGKKTLISYHFGGSVIWLFKWNANLMLEYFAEYVDNGSKREGTHTISPGFRYAHNAGSVQIVPGVGFPVQLNGSDKTKSVLVYLSFEHPF